MLDYIEYYRDFEENLIQQLLFDNYSDNAGKDIYKQQAIP